MNCTANKHSTTSAPPQGKLGDNTTSVGKLAERLRLIAASYYEGEDSCHDIDHAERVNATAIHIGKIMNARLDILAVSAILHDIGRRDESTSRGKICHAKRGAEIAQKILNDLGCKTDDVEAICHCIATHRFRDDNPPQSLEAKILFDADKLDSIGAVGIGRAFLFAGRVGARLDNQGIDIDSTAPYTIEDTAYREFRVKLCKVRDRMLTPAGRRLADDRHRFMEIFFSRLETEINGGPTDVQGS